MPKHCIIKVFGDVQGINFRYYTQELAQKLGVFGFVRNEKDGSVYVEAEGDEKRIKELIAWCKKGHKFARVTGIEVSWNNTLQGFKDFNIHR